MSTKMKTNIIFAVLAIVSASKPSHPSEHTTYIPIVSRNTDNKKGLAAGWVRGGEGDISMIEKLNISWCHKWIIALSQEERAICGSRILFVDNFWCDENIEYDLNYWELLDGLVKQMEKGERKGKIYLAFINEGDLPGQCNSPPDVIAQWLQQLVEIIDIERHPHVHVQIIGPQVSVHDFYGHCDDNHIESLMEMDIEEFIEYCEPFPYWREFHREYLLQTGEYAEITPSLHDYTHVIGGSAHMIDVFCQVQELTIGKTCLETGLWITEFGAKTRGLMCDKMNTYYRDPRIYKHAVFAMKIPKSAPEHEYSLFNEEGVLTPVGEGYLGDCDD